MGSRHFGLRTPGSAASPGAITLAASFAGWLSASFHEATYLRLRTELWLGGDNPKKDASEIQRIQMLRRDAGKSWKLIDLTIRSIQPLRF
jgi:hypothetical protein